MPRSQLKTLPLDRIRTDGDTQPRAVLDMFVVVDYAADIEAGAEFPPGEAVFDGEDYWLWDGFHRKAALAKAGKTTMEVNVVAGSLDDARWLALGANKSHGLRRCKADIEKAIKKALELRPDTPDGEIANHIGVARTTILNHRHQLESTCQIDKSPARTGRDGRTIDTSNIGKRPQPALDPHQQEPWFDPGKRPPKEDSGEQLGFWTPPDPAAEPPSEAPPPPPRYPHSDTLIAWLKRVQGETFVVRVEKGGIKAMLAEPDKWNWSDVKDYLLPQLADLQTTIAEFRKELERATKQR